MIIIVDDFLIRGKDQTDIDQKLGAVLDKSREVGLKFNPKKVKLRLPEVSYVGHVFSSEGLKPDPEKIRGINEMPPPTDKEGVRSILGIINYLDKFIEHKADLQGPISQLPQKDAAFVWEKPQQDAFDSLKSVITIAPVLAYFDNSRKMSTLAKQKQTVLHVDASSTGLGAVIMQGGKPIALSLKTLLPVREDMPTNMLAIVWGAQKFHTYICG